MKIIKSDSLFTRINGHLIDSPQPSNLSYLWNFGSLLGFCLIMQIITGIVLAILYNPNLLEAFNSIENIIIDINNGWLVCYLYSNAASVFFFLVYLHIGRGLYYGSYKVPKTLWIVTTIIFIIMIAFLHYNISSKWFINLDLCSNLSNVYISEVTINFLVNSFLAVFVINFTIFYLDDFKLSSNVLLKYLQIISFVILPVVLIFIAWSKVNFVDFICIAKDSGVDLHGHVNVTKEAAAELSKGVSTVGSQIGSSAAIVGIGGAVGKAIVKSSIPPVQKAAVVVGGGLLGGLIHSGLSHINRANALESIAKNSNVIKNSNNITNSLVNKFTDNSSVSPIEGLLFSIQGINAICFTLTIILIIQLVFKFYFKDNINLNLSSILGSNINNKLEYYLNKLIVLNKKVSVVYIWLILIILLIGLATSSYFSYELYSNMDKYIDIHNYLKNIK